MRARTRRAAAGPSKVPPATVYFWLVKVLTTGMGEATSDYLVHRFPPVPAVAAGGLALAGSLALQFAVRRYIAWAYWLAVVMVAVFGTMVADVVHVVLGVPYLVSTGAFLAALAVIFAVWHASEHTLSIHSIVTRRRETFYWATVMATFALGTAAGDLTAATMGLGFFSSGVMFAVVIAIPAIGYRMLGLGAVAAFWLAYIATRPLGASFADWMDMPHSLGGLEWGRGPVSLALTALIAAGVGYLTVTGADVRSRQGRHRASAGGPRQTRASAPRGDTAWSAPGSDGPRW